MATEYSEAGICIAMSEGTVIMDCCQSSYVCFASFARVAMVTIKKARAGNTIVKLFFRRYFSLFSCTIYQTPEALIKILSMYGIKLNLFLLLCQK